MRSHSRAPPPKVDSAVDLPISITPPRTGWKTIDFTLYERASSRRRNSPSYVATSEMKTGLRVRSATATGVSLLECTGGITIEGVLSVGSHTFIRTPWIRVAEAGTFLVGSEASPKLVRDDRTL